MSDTADSSIITPEQAKARAVEALAPQLNDALARGERRFNVPRFCAENVADALRAKGWTVPLVQYPADKTADVVLLVVQDEPPE